MIQRNTIVFLTCLLACVVPATAQETQRFTVPLSDPGRPIFLHASLISGGFIVEGYDGKEVEVEVAPETRHHRSDRGNGMRMIPSASLGLVVEEESNRVEIQGRGNSKIDVLKIRVPRRASMQLSCVNNGNIRVRGVAGNLELQNTNGDIQALEIDGSVVANTTNGDVKVTFVGLDRDLPMSFASFNGTVDVTFPKNLNADLRIESGQGDVFTDFDFELRPQAPSAERRREGGRFHLELNQAVHARVGKGGAGMHFKTWNGDVFIRSAGK